jgi:hypothetical protein
MVGLNVNNSFLEQLKSLLNFMLCFRPGDSLVISDSEGNDVLGLMIILIPDRKSCKGLRGASSKRN